MFLCHMCPDGIEIIISYASFQKIFLVEHLHAIFGFKMPLKLCHRSSSTNANRLSAYDIVEEYRSDPLTSNLDALNRAPVDKAIDHEDETAQIFKGSCVEALPL